MKPFDIPSHAVQIWAEGERTFIAMDGCRVELPKRDHTIERKGKIFNKLAVALTQTLRAREAATQNLLATPPHPTQRGMNSVADEVSKAWLKAETERILEAKAKVKAEKAAANNAMAYTLLQEIGLL